jgi:predicted nucleic acid-binding protein
VKFLLDTTAASQIGRRQAPPTVSAWLERVHEDDLALSVLSAGEMRRGIELVRGRDAAAAEALDRRLASLIERLGGRMLEVTAPIADRWGRLSAGPEPVPAIDGLIAATALVHGLTVVTRNTADFARCGVALLDPWGGEAPPA